jgi:hypothetical protein
MLRDTQEQLDWELIEGRLRHILGIATLASRQGKVEGKEIKSVAVGLRQTELLVAKALAISLSGPWF